MKNALVLASSIGLYTEAGDARGRQGAKSEHIGHT